MRSLETLLQNTNRFHNHLKGIEAWRHIAKNLLNFLFWKTVQCRGKSMALGIQCKLGILALTFTGSSCVTFDWVCNLSVF